jgi:hypothetical protein
MNQPARIHRWGCMSLPGLFPVSQTQSHPLQDATLHVNSRVTAQVLQVFDTQAILEIDGYPVVARLTSKGQAAELLSRRTADFVVTQLSSDQITLKLSNPSGGVGDQPIQVQIADLAADIAKELGLQGTKSEIDLIHQALLEHLPITREIVSQLLAAVDGSGLDINEGLQLAIRLKAAGLPVTPDSLKLAGQTTGLQMADSYEQMMAEFRDILSQSTTDQPLSYQIQTVLQDLEAMIPDLSMSVDQINASLQELFQFIGKPYEKLLNDRLAAGTKASRGAFDLFTLIQISKDLKQNGQTAAANSIDHFLELVRQNQFMNIKPDEVSGKGQWSEIAFCVQNAAGNDQKTCNTKIKVSYRSEKSPRKIDPEFTNLVLQVELEPTKEVVFNLSIYQKKVNAEITSQDMDVMSLFTESLPEFKELLSGLGYQVVQAGVQLKRKVDADGVSSLPADDLFAGELDIEV